MIGSNGKKNNLLFKFTNFKLCSTAEQTAALVFDRIMAQAKFVFPQP
jgi:hypothetical protein